MNPQNEWWFDEYNEGIYGHLKTYQNKCRIYLDEFPEQKELRDKYFYSTYIDREGNYYRVNKFAVKRFTRGE